MTGLVIRQEGRLTVLTLSRPPHNYFDTEMLGALAEVLEDADVGVRACVLRAEGRSFCAGAAFGSSGGPDPAAIYAHAVRLMVRRKPLVAAVRGAAIGGGLGLALVADMRVAAAGTSFHANFARLGICAGFGITYNLPRVVGAQKARDLLLTARRIGGKEALQIGLVDRLAAAPDVDGAALALADEIAANAPGALSTTRILLGTGEQEAFTQAIARELRLQAPLLGSADFVEGVAAARERRLPAFSDPKDTTA